MSVIQRSIQVGWQLRVFFTEDVFAPGNPLLHTVLTVTVPRKELVVLDDSLAPTLSEHGRRIEKYLTADKPTMTTVLPPLSVQGVINEYSRLSGGIQLARRGGHVESGRGPRICDAIFFKEWEREAEKRAAFEPAAMKHLSRRCAELHLDHIATNGDPFDTGSA